MTNRFTREIDDADPIIRTRKRYIIPPDERRVSVEGVLKQLDEQRAELLRQRDECLRKAAECQKEIDRLEGELSPEGRLLYKLAQVRVTR